MLLRVLCTLGLLLTVHCVQATCIGVGCTCSVTATPVTFTSYSPISGAAINTTGTVSVTCSALIVGLNVSYVIALNAGVNGTFAARKMKFSTSTLQYNLYTTAANTTIWGDGTASTSTVSDSYILSIISNTRNYTVYGNLPASQNVIPGSYTDTITVTVTY